MLNPIPRLDQLQVRLLTTKAWYQIHEVSGEPEAETRRHIEHRQGIFARGERDSGAIGEPSRPLEYLE